MSTRSITRRGLGLLVGSGVAVSACSAKSAANVAGRAKPIPALANSLRSAVGTVSAFPPPGSQTASPQTTISFRGGSATTASQVSVAGSVSGSHTGKLAAHSDGGGVSFVPAKPFTAGETVTVTTLLAVRGSSAGVMRFKVSSPATPSAGATASASATAQSPITGFVSNPDAKAPVLTVAVNRSTAASGLAALSPKGGGLPGQLMLTRSDGSLVWRHEAPTGLTANDLKMQQYQGKPVLTWWQGTQTPLGYGNGENIIVGADYARIASVKAGNGYSADLHEFQLTDRGTALMTIYAPVEWNLQPYGGSTDGIALDSIVQEVDVATGLVVFEWHALDHVAPETSYFAAPTSAKTAWDFFHVNSIDVGPDDNLLISARHTSDLTNLDRASGDVLWTLGGKASDFTTQGSFAFFCQHDARWQADGSITLFDDEGGPPRHAAASRALRLIVDTDKRTAGIVKVFNHPKPVVANSQGSTQLLANGNLFVGWGDQPALTEFDASGMVVWDATLPTGVSSYRARRLAWTGAPSRLPATALVTHGTRRKVYASWNGDTRAASWRLLGVVGDATTPTVLATTAGGVFEIVLTVPAGARRLRVQALDTAGKALATVSVS
jgi:hypothetical protein